MEIILNTFESDIIDILENVVNQYAPNTTLRITGGWVRDKLLSKESNDMDISIDNMSGKEFAELLVKYLNENKISHNDIAIIEKNSDQSKHLETARLKINDIELDFVQLRSETYADSRIPQINLGTPKEDALRRDLTFNALFFNLRTKEIEDLTERGLHDLQWNICRTPIDPIQTFLDDPLRILRIVRFAAKQNAEVVPEIIEAAKNEEVQDALFQKVSKERIWAEMFGNYPDYKGFMIGDCGAIGLKLLNEMDLTELLFDVNNLDWDRSFNIYKRMFLAKPFNQNSSREEIESGIVRGLSALLFFAGDSETTLDIIGCPKKIQGKIYKFHDVYLSHYFKTHFKENIPSDTAIRVHLFEKKEFFEDTIDLYVSMYYKTYDDEQFGNEFFLKFERIKNRCREMIKQLGGFTAKKPIDGNDLVTLGIELKEIGKALKYIDIKLTENPNLTKEEALELCSEFKLLPLNS